MLLCATNACLKSTCFIYWYEHALGSVSFHKGELQVKELVSYVFKWNVPAVIFACSYTLSLSARLMTVSISIRNLCPWELVA